MKNKKKDNLFYRNRFVIISFLVTAGTMLILYMITQIFPFGDNTVLRMDLYHQYGPLFSELYDRLMNHDGLTYSWQSGLGSCFLGNYFNYLSSPIGAIVVFFGHKHVPEAIAAMILIKAALSSATFTYYLKKSQHSHSIMGVAFGVLYAFCAYMLAYYWNVMWLDAMVLLPIVLLGIERIIDNGSIRIYVGSLALSLFSNYYMSFMLCMFAVIYFFYYYIMRYPRKAVISEQFRDEHPKGIINKLKNSRFLSSGFRFAGASLLAAGLIAFALIPTYKILQTCSATSGSFPDDLKSYFNFFDFFANHLAALETTIRSSGDDVLPNVYCGMLAVILAPLFFFTKSISKKEKLTTLGLLAVFYISFNCNYFNYIWHGMHFPNDLPYRFSFMYSFILLVMAYKTFVRLNEFTSKQIGVIGAAILAFVFIIDKVESKNVDSATIYVTLIFTVVYVMMLTLFKDKKYEITSVAVLMCVCVCSEVIIADVGSFPNNINRASYVSDYDDFRTVKERLDTIEQDNFYRMELTDLRTRMDPCWFGYNGVSIFSSMAYEKVAKLENRLGMMSNDINSYTYNPQTPVYNMMHSLKYIVNNETPNVLSNKYYKKITSQSKYTAYENKYYLPIAFGVNTDIKNWDYKDSISAKDVNPFEVQGDFFEKATGVSDPFEKVSVSYINYNNINAFPEITENGIYSYTKTTADSDGSATFFITTQKKGNIYIYYNVDNASEKDITVNSSIGTITHSASQDCILDLGRYDANETISINVPFEGNNGNLRLYVYTINDSILNKGYEKLSDRAFNVEKFENTLIEGTFSTKEDCVLYTSIPYDAGWYVYVDGEKVDNDSLVAIGDAFLGINIEKGNHEIKFEYHVQGLSTGLKISAGSLVILIAIIIISILRKRKSPSKKRPVYSSPNKYYSEDILIKPAARPQIRQTASNPQTVVVKRDNAKPIVRRELITPPVKTNNVHREVISVPKKEKRDGTG
ncbi:MAG: YfhO family protein, partial [Acutalibacteraceae bacterium]